MLRKLFAPRVVAIFYGLHLVALLVATPYVMLHPELRNSVALLQFVSFYALILSCAGALQAVLAEKAVREEVDELDE